jgi:16S rRNA (uracil1498-N3)-methyltransferase
MSRRFFCETPLASVAVGKIIPLNGDEAHHLGRVMRAKVGDEIELFDGLGGSCSGRLTSVTKQTADVELITQPELEPLPTTELTLAVALPKGDRQHWLIEKCTELGVSQLIPLSSANSVAEANDNARERMRRWGMEACKQCGRSRLLEIQPPLSMSELRKRFAKHPCRLVAHPGGKELAQVVTKQPATAVVAIGAEGGFIPDEVAALNADGWQSVQLGPQILRIETAAIAVAAFFLLHE